MVSCTEISRVLQLHVGRVSVDVSQLTFFPSQVVIEYVTEHTSPATRDKHLTFNLSGKVLSVHWPHHMGLAHQSLTIALDCPQCPQPRALRIVSFLVRPGINPACRRALCIRNSRLFSVRFAQQLPSFWASRRQSGSYPQTRSRLLAQNKVAPITESVAAFYGALPATPPMLATVSPFFIEGTAHTYRTTPARRRTRFPHRL